MSTDCVKRELGNETRRFQASDPGCYQYVATSGAGFYQWLKNKCQHKRSGSALQCSSSEIVLMIDGNTMRTQLFRAFFARYGLKAKVFTNSVAAFDWYGSDHRKIELIFLDMHMPGLSAAECFENIFTANPHVKVALMSGALDTARIEQLMQYPQVHGFFTKPVNYYELVDWSRQMLREGRVGRQWGAV